MNEPLPANVARLVEERTAARAAHDWGAADALRDRIRDAGWEVVDSAHGSTARPALPPPPPDLPSLLEEPASVRATILAVVDDHPEDLERLLRGLAAHAPSVDWELVVVANAPAEPVEPLVDAAWRGDASLPPATLLLSATRLGWADAVNFGLRRCRGAFVILLDTSLEPTGDPVAPLLEPFDDPAVGIAGGWGVTSRNGRDFVDAPPGEVDAVEGYAMALRREALRKVGGFDPHFRFYRHADLDLSFAIRNAGWKALRIAALPVEQHAHRGWEALPTDERDRLSKRNFYRFLKHWRDRSDLLLRRA